MPCPSHAPATSTPRAASDPARFPRSTRQPRRICASQRPRAGRNRRGLCTGVPRAAPPRSPGTTSIASHRPDPPRTDPIRLAPPRSPPRTAAIPASHRRDPRLAPPRSTLAPPRCGSHLRSCTGSGRSRRCCRPG
jgi:hypothetical protein